MRRAVLCAGLAVALLPSINGVVKTHSARRKKTLMFTTQWSTSERKYDVIVERDVKVPMPDGTLLDGDIYRPASDEKFPVILGVHGYNKDLPIAADATRRLHADARLHGKRRFDFFRPARLHPCGIQLARHWQVRGFLPAHGTTGSGRRLPSRQLVGSATVEQWRHRHVRRFVLSRGWPKLSPQRDRSR